MSAEGFVVVVNVEPESGVVAAAVLEGLAESDAPILEEEADDSPMLEEADDPAEELAADEDGVAPACRTSSISLIWGQKVKARATMQAFARFSIRALRRT